MAGSADETMTEADESSSVPTPVHSCVARVISSMEKAMPSLSRANISNNGLTNLRISTIQDVLRDVQTALEELDAESMLRLNRVSSPEEKGAEVGHGMRVRPIHDEITPPPPPCRLDGNQQRCVRYLHVTESPDRYSIGMFIFPPGAIIPLHDHPGMCVLSRVLYGELRVRSYDLVPEDDDANDNDTTTTAEKNNNTRRGSWLTNLLRRSFTSLASSPLPYGSKKAHPNPITISRAPDVIALYPRKGNMHEFTAGSEGAAVLDVLFPPYDFDHDRDCTFYREQTVCGANGGGYCYLVPIPQPPEFHCIGGKYLDWGEEDEEEEEEEE